MRIIVQANPPVHVCPFRLILGRSRSIISSVLFPVVATSSVALSICTFSTLFVSSMCFHSVGLIQNHQPTNPAPKSSKTRTDSAMITATKVELLGSSSSSLSITTVISSSNFTVERLKEAVPSICSIFLELKRDEFCLFFSRPLNDKTHFNRSSAGIN